METITIRGHHLFDMLGALGTGESKHKTLGPVAQKIRANPTVPIKVVIGVDDICAPIAGAVAAGMGYELARGTRDR